MTRVRRILAGEVADLAPRAAADDHEVLAPTHIVEKNGEIVGYLSVGAVPVVNVWMDSEKVKARDSVQVLSTLDSIMDHSGVKQYFMPCAVRSPYRPLMGKMGFDEVMDSTLFVKRL